MMKTKSHVRVLEIITLLLACTLLIVVMRKYFICKRIFHGIVFSIFLGRFPQVVLCVFIKGIKRSISLTGIIVCMWFSPPKVHVLETWSSV